MKEYLDLFIDEQYPDFIDKYLATKTLTRLKHVTQFCGCDYTNLYSPLFLYTRFDHSVVVAHMTWHFTHDKKETIAALFHDLGTPCFAHCIDYVFGDYMNQESSEKSIVDMIQQDKEILDFLKEDGFIVADFADYLKFHVLENKSPKLCTDRLDGVLHTCYVWLHTHSLEQIKEVYDNMVLLRNEDDTPEVGFNDVDVAEKFVSMVYNYAKELQGNTDKYVMKFVSEIVKLAVEQNLISFEDLYTKKEEELCNIFSSHFLSWDLFKKATTLITTDTKPKNQFYISFETKKRNTIPLVHISSRAQRVFELSDWAKEQYQKLNEFKDSSYAYIEEIKNLH